jgi:hypothetical protein
VYYWYSLLYFFNIETGADDGSTSRLSVVTCVLPHDTSCKATFCQKNECHVTCSCSETKNPLHSVSLRTTWRYSEHGRSQWPRGLRRKSAAAWLLGSRVRIPLRAWMSLVFIRCVVLCRQRPLRRADHSSVCLIVCVITETTKGALCSSWEPTGKWWRNDSEYDTTWMKFLIMISWNVSRHSSDAGACKSQGRYFACGHTYKRLVIIGLYISSVQLTPRIVSERSNITRGVQGLSSKPTFLS